MAKNLKFQIMADEVTSINISKYKDGYNYASISALPGYKKEESCDGPGCPSDEGPTEYISVSYEWKGDNVPDAVMDIMSFVNTSKASIDMSIEEKSQTWEEYKEERIMAKKGKKKKC